MTEIELGVKRRCIGCGTKFYDFFKSPIICPNCGAEFDPEQLLKSRKGRVSSKLAVVEVTKNEKDEEEFEDAALLNEGDLETDLDNAEEDGLPSDEDSFIPVGEDEDEETAPATFEDDEEFMDNLSEEVEDDDIDDEGETIISSKEQDE